MNGSRSNPSRPVGTSSLDALSRTIEGLEARIEGLIGNAAREGVLREAVSRPVRAEAPQRETLRPPLAERQPPAAADRRTDPLSEIRERQRALEASRVRPAGRDPLTETQTRRTFAAAPEMQAPAPTPLANPAFETPAAKAVPDMLAREITQALLSLRLELKKDISDGLAREVDTLRAEIRSIRSLVQERPQGEDMRRDIARLADGISLLGNQSAPGTDTLKAEFEDLRSLMDGLARDDTVRHIESRWDTLESKLDGFDAEGLQGELVALADRLDGIKSQLGSIGDNRAIRALEDKLIAVATALEQIGTHIDPGERGISDQFAGLDMRLDEISRAISVSNRGQMPAADNGVMARLEGRIAGIAEQIDSLSRQRARGEDAASAELGRRIEGLTLRVEELASDRSATRLEERLDQLSLMLERSQAAVPQPELTGYLADISRKIDALDQGAINDPLAERLDDLARRIEDLQLPQMAPSLDTKAMRGLEERLNFVVERLEDTARAPADDTSSLRGLEEQIAHLSSLINAAPVESGVGAGQFAGRMSALEDYMATSDEYIIEAARHAAEAVMESYAHQAPQQGGSTARDVETLSALADHLKHLEDISRGSEERTHKTFEALHETLLQIADRLDGMQNQGPLVASGGMFAGAAPAEAPVPAPMFASAEPFGRAPSAEPVASGLENAYADAAEALNTYPAYPPAPVAPPMPRLSETVDEPPAAERIAGRVEKPSLLAGLSKLIPGQKKSDPAAQGRTLIDPAPSIDPIDVMPPEEANELLEPGSGAPDVRKILERVRATQAAKLEAGGGLPPLNDADRTDYIAAARRAAQAAALESDRAQRNPAGGTFGEGNSRSLLSRYRRPILMAVGAVLLAAMAMPLVSTLLSDDQPQQPAIEAPVETPAPASELETPPASVLTPAPEPTEAPAAVESGALAPPVGAPEIVLEGDSAPMATPSEPPILTGPAPIGGGAVPPTLSAPTEDVSEASAAAAPVASPEPAPAAVAMTPPAIEIPAVITPPSLVTAAKEGDPLALFEIAARYTEGRGVEKSLTEAARWYQLSADKGFAPAQYRLANLYEKGTGIERNIEAASRYYQQAADAGNASAMHNLAVINASGSNGKQDYAKAAEWFGKAAELGVSDSQFNLAILYARGNGVQPDLEASYKWFAIAAKGGDTDAAQKRDEVANAMKPEQLAKAKAAVELWKAQPLNADANSVEPPDEWAGKGVKTASVDMKRAIANIQAILKKNGFDVGNPDGVMGAKTVAAIKAFQTSIGQKPTGQINDGLVKELLARNK